MNTYEMPLDTVHFGRGVITKVEQMLSDGSKIFNLELSGVIDCVDEKTADAIMAYLEYARKQNVAL